MKQSLTFLLAFFMLSLFGQIQIGDDIDGEAVGDNSGKAISLSGDGQRIAIGAISNDDSWVDSGHVRIYEENNGNWVQIGNDLDALFQSEFFGFSVALSEDGKRVVIGAPSGGGAAVTEGQTYIYEESGGSWYQVGTILVGDDLGDEFGYSVSISNDGKRIAVGAPEFNGIAGFHSGLVRVFEEIGGNWTQLGNDLTGEATEDRSGYSVTLSGDGNRLGISSPLNDGATGMNSGHVRIYEENNGIWTQLGSDIDGEAAGDGSGGAISLTTDGEKIAIGSRFNNATGSSCGQVRVFQEVGGSWMQYGNNINGTHPYESFGNSLDLSATGHRIIIGAIYNDELGQYSGKVKVYDDKEGAWVQSGTDIYSEAASDSFGAGVSISDDGLTLAAGAEWNDGVNGLSSGHVRLYQGLAFPVSIINVSPALYNLNLSPNPTNGLITLNMELGRQEELTIIIHDFLGQPLIEQRISSHSKIISKSFDLNQFSNGIYFVEVLIANERIQSKIILVK